MPPPKEVSQSLKLVTEDAWASDRLWEGQRRGACRCRDDWIKVCRWPGQGVSGNRCVCECVNTCGCVFVSEYVCLSALDCVSV